MRTYSVQRMLFENLMLTYSLQRIFFFCTWITVCSDQFKFGLLRESKSCVWKASVHFFDFGANWCAGWRALVLILHRISDLNVLKRSLALCVHRYSDLNKMISMFGNILSGMQEKFLFWLRDEESLIFCAYLKKASCPWHYFLAERCLLHVPTWQDAFCFGR